MFKIYKALKYISYNYSRMSLRPVTARTRRSGGMGRCRKKFVHSRRRNTPRHCKRINFKPLGAIRKDVPVQSVLLIPRKYSAPAASVVLGTKLWHSPSGVKQSLKEGLNDRPKVWNFGTKFIRLRLPMVHGRMICAVGIVKDIPVRKRIYD